MNSSDCDQDMHSTKKANTRGRGRGRGRPPGKSAKKNKKKVSSTKDMKEDIDNDVENDVNSSDILKTSNSDLSPKLDDTIDSELTTHPMSFVSPSSKPLHKNEPLNWKCKVNLIGEKVVNPRIHCCEKCQLPILVYGRMIACKHVFCLSCAKQNESVCLRCNEKVLRVEKSGLGTVFMCQTESCKRTYLSQRDLQAHIQHRHVRRLVTPSGLNPSNNTNTISTTSPVTNVTQSHLGTSTNPRTVSYSSSTYQSPIPVVSSRSNLITVPIQEEVNQIPPAVNPQTPMIVGGQQAVANYVSPQPPPYGHHTPHMQWAGMPNANAFPYRPPPWQPMAHPYNNPYNRPYYPQ